MGGQTKIQSPFQRMLKHAKNRMAPYFRLFHFPPTTQFVPSRMKLWKVSSFYAVDCRLDVIWGDMGSWPLVINLTGWLRATDSRLFVWLNWVSFEHISFVCRYGMGEGAGEESICRPWKHARMGRFRPLSPLAMWCEIQWASVKELLVQEEFWWTLNKIDKTAKKYASVHC